MPAPKSFLDRPNCFWRVQIVLVRSKSFWLGPNHFGQVQIRLFWTNFYNSDLSRMIWTRPKWFGPNQNNFYSSKTIWLVQNHFRPIEGQGIRNLDKVILEMNIWDGNALFESSEMNLPTKIFLFFWLTTNSSYWKFYQRAKRFMTTFLKILQLTIQCIILMITLFILKRFVSTLK